LEQDKNNLHQLLEEAFDELECNNIDMNTPNSSTSDKYSCKNLLKQLDEIKEKKRK